MNQKASTTSSGAASRARVVALDWARALAIVDMIVAHLGNSQIPFINGIPAVRFAVLFAVLAGTTHRALSPLQAMGSMSLTAYILHVVTAGHLLQYSPDPLFWNAVITTITALLAFAMLWNLTSSRRGPAEWALHTLTKKGRRL